MENFTKTIKKRVSQFLNEATTAVVHSYARYLGSDLPENLKDPSKGPKTFKEFHDAGKSAASHLESLLKLAHATDNSGQQQKEDDEKQRKHELQKQVESARAELGEDHE